ncbi:3-hydroxyacyl-CoA dehydrogenase family protein [Thalassobaculum sp.]|uniref:3-hydroxyacyl-CoA dehydrogenase family protein n=1 Tax=Thalassobaculum sp. TaxID=2022740 RepID=UPI0032EF79F2
MTIQKIGVCGAGMMGSEIALVFALADRKVRLMDTDKAFVDKAMKKLEATLDSGIGRGFYTEADKPRALANIETSTDVSSFGDVDMVIEAVTEDQAVKAKVYKDLDAVLKPDAIIASNTSSISISVLASNFSEARQKNFLGLHFFSPVTRMKLVEVISGFDSDPEVVKAATQACEDVGKSPIQVKDVVGFAVNRILFAMWDEAIRLVEEGACTPEDIDTGCKLGLGHPVGPFELMDNITLDLTLKVSQILEDAYGDRMHTRPTIKQLHAAGRLGRRYGRGWYRYDDKGKRVG